MSSLPSASTDAPRAPRRGRRPAVRLPYLALALCALGTLRAELPEVVLPNLNPTALASDSTYLYVAAKGSGLETCATQNHENAVLIRVEKDDPSNVTTLVQACHEDIDAMVVVDGSIYYRSADQRIYQRATGGVSNPDLRVDEETGTSGLATDGDALFWILREGTSSEVRTAPLAGGASTVLANFTQSGTSPRQLAIDSTHLYWAEGSLGDGSIRRVALSGGAVTTLADSSDGLDNTSYLGLDATHVYFGGQGNNRVQRVAKTGGQVMDLVSDWDSDLIVAGVPEDDGYMLQGLIVDGDWIAWSDTTGGFDGRVRRRERSGTAVADESLTDLQILSLGPRFVHASGGAIYWGEHGRVQRTPIDSAGVQIDLVASRIEVTQVIQDFATPTSGNVPLVEEKITWARVYPQMTYEDDFAENTAKQKGVTAHLRGFRDGVELPESPLTPATPAITVYPGALQRDRLERTFNFRIPDSWTFGTLTLRAEVNPGQQISELDPSNNELTDEYTFTTPRPLCLFLIPVEVEAGTADVADIAMEPLLEMLGILWPTGPIYQRSLEAIQEGGGPYEYCDDSSKILDKLRRLRVWIDYPSNWCHDGFGRPYFVGVATPTSGCFTGVAPLSDNVSLILKDTGQPTFSIPRILEYQETFGTQEVLTALPSGGITLAHELAHNNGRLHVDCNGPDFVDEGYPYNVGSFFNGLSAGAWGFDRRAIGSPLYREWTIVSRAQSAGELMGYCSPRWVSDYTYRACFEALDGEIAGRLDDPFEANDQILLLGLVFSSDVAQPNATLNSAQKVSGSLFSAEKRAELSELSRDLAGRPGAWSVDFLFADGTLLTSIPFVPPEAPPEAPDESSMLFPLRFPRGASTLEIRYNGESIISRDVRLSFPTVEVLSPNGGEVLTDLTVRWTGSTSGQNRAIYDVHYSPDAGESWIPIAFDVAGTSYRLEQREAVPGSRSARVRVVISDGINTAVDESDVDFELRGQPPRPVIHAPRPRFVQTWSDLVVLEGRAFDAENLELEGQLLTWFVDGVFVGRGRHADVRGLAVGRHTARLEAVDLEAMTASTTVEFWVARGGCPPANPDLELLWLFESSTHLRAFETAACSRIEGYVSDLEGMGLRVRSEIAVVLGDHACALREASDIDAETEVANADDWHHAIVSVADHYDWGDATRVIVNVADLTRPLPTWPTGPVVQSALGAGVQVATWVIPERGGDVSPEALQRATTISEKTGGVVFDWSSSSIPAELFSLKFESNCKPIVSTAIPAQIVNRNVPVALVGEFLEPGVSVEVNGREVRDVEFAPDGSWMRFDLPLDTEPGELEIIIGRPGQPLVVIEDLVSLSPPGDTTPPDIDCPQPLVVQCEDDEGARVVFPQPSVQDDTDAAPSVSCEPASGSRFPRGSTDVVCVARDASGNSSQCVFRVTVSCGAEELFRRGDANVDGTADLSDAIATLSHLFTGGSLPACPDSADSNDDGTVDVSDAIWSLAYLFTGGPAPPAPGPMQCGADPTPDALGPCVVPCD